MSTYGRGISIYEAGCTRLNRSGAGNTTMLVVPSGNYYAELSVYAGSTGAGYIEASGVGNIMPTTGIAATRFLIGDGVTVIGVSTIDVTYSYVIFANT